MALAVNPVNTLPTTQSSAAAWIEWHRALLKAYGKAEANTTLLRAWQRRGLSAANTAELRTYLTAQGISIEGETFSFVADAWASAKGLLSFTGGLTKYALIAVVVVVLLFLFNLARKPEQAIGAAKFLV